MRRRELIRKLDEIKSRSWRAPWFPTRDDVLRLYEEEIKRLRDLYEMLPEIIEKLDAH
jgi:hypothetical protein